MSATSSPSNKVLDTAHYSKFPKGYKMAGTHTPKRVPVPLEIQSLVTGSLPYDQRKQGEKPPKLDIYSTMISDGLDATKLQYQSQGHYLFTEDELKVPDVTEDVLWIDNEENEQIAQILEAYNVTREGAGLKRLRGVVPIVCAMLRRGAALAPTKKV